MVEKEQTLSKRMEQEMRHADRLALVGQLASGLAHEIGTPLNIIAGNAELLRMDLQTQGVATAELDAIIEQADRLTRLIDKFLTLARAQELPRVPLALYEPLRDALRLLETRFARQAITVLVDVPADLPLVLGAADQLQQVFLNLLVNAWHAMPHGDTVTITACALPDRRVQICCRDTEVGMTATDLAWAFEPLYTTKGSQGTGLGLAICKQIIDSYQGSITLESTPDGGTTVTVILPPADAGTP